MTLICLKNNADGSHEAVKLSLGSSDTGLPPVSDGGGVWNFCWEVGVLLDHKCPVFKGYRYILISLKPNFLIF